MQSSSLEVFETWLENPKQPGLIWRTHFGQSIGLEASGGPFKHELVCQPMKNNVSKFKVHHSYSLSFGLQGSSCNIEETWEKSVHVEFPWHSPLQLEAGQSFHMLNVKGAWMLMKQK